jgi:hypothetical protein
LVSFVSLRFMPAELFRIVMSFRVTATVLSLVFLAAAAPVGARNQDPKPQPDATASQAEPGLSRSDVVRTAEQYKASLERLIRLQEALIKRAAEMVEKREELFAQGLISRVELEHSQAAQADAKAKLEETVNKISEAGHLIAEARLEEELQQAKQPDPGVVIRYTGPEIWSLSKLVKIENFFVARFGHTLPVSALGQTALHDQLGFKHGDAIDIAVHPDSPQGQELMSYLRSAGISFIAFRTAVPGSATGAHIHIGRPSPKNIVDSRGVISPITNAS